jgi:hypothetical protein
MTADAALSSTGVPAAWIVPAVPSGTPPVPPLGKAGTFSWPEAFNENVSASGYSGAHFLIAKQGFVTMSEAMLRSIDDRLQRVAEDVGNMKVQLGTVENKLTNLADDVKKLPTWGKMTAAIVGGIGLLGGLITWLASGGAAFLAKVFAGP